MKTLSTIFGSGVTIRNALYDHRVLKVRKLSRPVVSIGNISVGGSGKTPFVIALGELLKQRSIAFDVLSRGYGRKSSAIEVVDPEGRPEEFGDEPLLIARSLQVPVVVGADRYRAGLVAEKRFDTRLHLLDDGFQHRGLHRDFDIVMLPASDLHDALLPLGRLREPLSALRRSDAVVISAAEQPKTARLPMFPEKIWTAHRVLQIDQGAGKAVAFCGIARPEQFFSQLKSRGINVASSVTFRDHHRYSQPDIDRLLQAKRKSGAECFITTRKDQINLTGLTDRLQRLHVADLRLVLEGDVVLGDLLKTLEQRCGCRF